MANITKSEKIEAFNLRTLREGANDAIKETKAVASYFVYKNGVMFFYGCNKAMQTDWQKAEAKHRESITRKGLELVLFTDFKKKVFREIKLLGEPRIFTPQEAEEIREEMKRFLLT